MTTSLNRTSTLNPIIHSSSLCSAAAAAALLLADSDSGFRIPVGFFRFRLTSIFDSEFKALKKSVELEL